MSSHLWAGGKLLIHKRLSAHAALFRTRQLGTKFARLKSLSTEGSTVLLDIDVQAIGNSSLVAVFSSVNEALFVEKLFFVDPLEFYHEKF